MSKRIKLITIFIFLIISVNIKALSPYHSNISSPLFLSTSETDTIFRNPAELLLHNRVIDTYLRWGATDQKFSLGAILHLSDSMGKRDSFGDLAISIETFGTDFMKNITWVTNSEGEGEFTLADAGYNLSLTWAKDFNIAVAGLNLKKYHYRNLRDPNSQRDSIGLDAGFYIKPFRDLYLGVVATNIGTTTIRDQNLNTMAITETELLLTSTIFSGKDTTFSIGVPINRLKELEKNHKTFLKYVSIQAKKVFNNTLEIGVGSNTKNIYANIGLNISPFVSVGSIYSFDTENVFDTDFTVQMTFGIPHQTNKFNKNKSSNKYRKYRKSKFNEIDKQNKKVHKKIKNKSLDPIEMKIDDKIDDIKIRKLKRKKRQYRKLKEELENI